ncbi:YceK/YidQ family lipoprotein [Enterobacter sp. RIT418]|uniref:YceK/YidQ family lipoprotein n=1 Tax=Enterobacter sp. RIT418 TaxID=2202164 RepID=UPI000D4F907E|nr:YceK/YidQ family lipoprotein [Enterobacter sp. RIT 418]RAU35777.1 hypothetical protein DBY73_011030 [Enterobacter sp. RIT 418]
MKKWMLSKAVLSLCLMSLAAQLSGCGTLARGDSYKDTYRGVDRDKKEITNAYLWVPSFGLWPLFHIISLPIDAVIDTVLLPVDLVLSHTPKKELAQSAENIPVFAANLTNSPDFSYSIQNKRTGEILTTGITSKIPQSGSLSPTFDIVSIVKSKYPEPRIDPVKIKWEVSSISGNSRGATTTFTETRTPTSDLRFAKSIIMLFMPCNSVMVINSERSFYNSNIINQKLIQDSYKKLAQMAMQSQCAPAEINPEIQDVWK